MAIQAYVRMAVTHIVLKRPELSPHLFVTYLLGRVNVTPPQKVVIMVRLVINSIVVGIECAAALTHLPIPATRCGNTAGRIITTIMEGAIAVTVLAHLLHQTSTLKPRSRHRWISKLIILIGWGLVWGICAILNWASLCTTLPIVA